MKKTHFVAGLILIVVLAFLGIQMAFSQENKEKEPVLNLPDPKIKGNMSLEETIKKRRCVRKYSDKAMTLEQLSQLLWSGGGKTGDYDHLRAAPSAGGLHPLDFYAVVGKGSVKGLEAGVYHYEPLEHKLKLHLKGDEREELKKSALGQGQVGTAEVVIVITIEFERTTKKYGDRGRRYAYMDSGFACENMFLQVLSLDLSACVVGAFHDDKVAETLKLPENYKPALFLTIGYPQ